MSVLIPTFRWLTLGVVCFLATSGKAADARPVMGGRPTLSATRASQIEDMVKFLGSRKRNVDPFGLSMYPREKPVPGEEPKDTKNQPERLADTVKLNEALRSIKVSLINPSNKEFVVQGRIIYEGDFVILQYRSEVFVAKVMQVTASKILLRDPKRNENGEILLSIIPEIHVEPLNSAKAKLDSYALPMEPLKNK